MVSSFLDMSTQLCELLSDELTLANMNAIIANTINQIRERISYYESGFR